MVMINYRERFKIKISKGERCLSQAKEKLQKTDKQNTSLGVPFLWSFVRPCLIFPATTWDNWCQVLPNRRGRPNPRVWLFTEGQ